MKAKLLFGAGMAAGYVLGSRSGRAAYEKLKARAAELWESKPVQDKVAAAAEAVKEKAPEVSEQLSEAARRAGTVIGSATHGSGRSTTAPTRRARLRPAPDRRIRPGAERPDRPGLVRRRRRHPGRTCDQRGSGQGALAGPAGCRRITTVASSSSERTTRAVRPLRRTVRRSGSLPPARLDQQVAARRQPLRRRGGHPPLHVQPVGAAVEGGPRLMQAGLLRHGPDRGRGHVGGVDRQHPDRPRSPAGSGSKRSPSWTSPPSGRTFRRAHATAAGSTSAACSSTGPASAASAAPTAPDPQQRSTTTGAGRAPPDGPRSRAACRTRNSVRRRGTKTPASTAILSPQNSAQPRMCSSGSPATLRSTSRRVAAGVCAACDSRRASSSAKTQPAARSFRTIAASGTGRAGMGPFPFRHAIDWKRPHATEAGQHGPALPGGTVCRLRRTLCRCLGGGGGSGRLDPAGA